MNKAIEQEDDTQEINTRVSELQDFKPSLLDKIESKEINQNIHTRIQGIKVVEKISEPNSVSSLVKQPSHQLFGSNMAELTSPNGSIEKTDLSPPPIDKAYPHANRVPITKTKTEFPSRHKLTFTVEQGFNQMRNVSSNNII